MEVIPGKGTDQICFGASEEDVVSILGIPDKVYLTDSGCQRIQFNALQLELSFEPENQSLLGWMEIHNPNAILFGETLIGKKQIEVIGFLSAKLGAEPTTDDYGSFVSVNYEDQCVELQFEFGQLRSINLGAIYNESDEPQWPNS